MLDWFRYNTVIVLVGVSLLGACAGVIGCFAVLRKRSLVGDALAHASLPGVCAAYLVVGNKHFLAMLAGAFLAGLASIGAMAFLKRWTRLKEDACIALILSTFFGAGLVLRSVIRQREGSGQAGLDSFIFGTTAGMVLTDVYFIASLAGGTLLIVILLYKEFKLVAFDPDFAQVQGWPARLLDFALMLLLLGAVVIGLPAVGVLMMAALLIIPAAAARFWTHRLAWMLFLAGGFGAGAGVIGGAISASFENIPAGPSIILVCTLCFGISLLFAPTRGIIARLLARRRDRLHLRAELASGREPTP